jgi:hypothetical protein
MMKMQQAAMMAQQTGQPPMPPPPDEDILRTSQLWQEITSDMLGDTDLDVYIDLASMSPVTEEVQRNSWNQVLALLTNQQILFVMAMSPVLLRKTLALYGIRSEQEIQEVQRVAQMVIGTQMQMAQQQQIQGAAEAAGKAGVNPQLVQALTQEAQGGINGASPGTSAIPEAQSMMSDLSAVGGGPPVA